jgi:hypothetical protein
MPYPGYVNMTFTPEARKATYRLVVAMTAKYQRRFTISDAIIRAARDIEREIEREAAQETALAASGR